MLLDSEKQRHTSAQQAPTGFQKDPFPNERMMQRYNHIIQQHILFKACKPKYLSLGFDG